MTDVKFANRASHQAQTVGTLRALAREAAKEGTTPDLLALLTEATVDADRKKRIAARLKELRELSPYTQENIAAKLNLSLRGYQKIEKTGGTSFPNYELLAAIHGVPVESLWQDPDEVRSNGPSLEERLAGLEAKLDELLAIAKDHVAYTRAVVEGRSPQWRLGEVIERIDRRQEAIIEAASALLPSEDENLREAARSLVDAAQPRDEEGSTMPPGEVPSGKNPRVPSRRRQAR